MLLTATVTALELVRLPLDGYVCSYILSERSRAMLPWATHVRGESAQDRDVGRVEYEAGDDWPSLLCALQRMEADVRPLISIFLLRKY